MIIYILLFIILICLKYICKDNKKLFCLLAGIILWSLLAFRSINIGVTDTSKLYKPFFEKLINMNLNDIFAYKWMSDKAFYILMKFISLFTKNFQIVLAILAIPYVFFSMYIIEKKSPNPLLSVIIYVSLYYMYATFLLRQVFAVGIILFSLQYIEKKDFKRFLITVLIASLFHVTALIFLLVYPFALKNKYGIKNYIYILIAFIISISLKKIILFILPIIDFTGRIKTGFIYSSYSSDGKISMFGLLILIVILLFSNHYYQKMKENDKKNTDILFNISTLGAVFFALSKILTEFYRVSIYFSIVNILLLPMALNKENDQKKKKYFEIAIIILFILYFLFRTINNVNANPYMFFWED